MPNSLDWKRQSVTPTREFPSMVTVFRLYLKMQFEISAEDPKPEMETAEPALSNTQWLSVLIGSCSHNPPEGV